MNLEKTMTGQCGCEKQNVGGASTFGWDTTFTTSYQLVNEEIGKKSTYPADFNNTTEAHELLDYLSGTNPESFYQLLKPSIKKGSRVKLEGKWGQWKLQLRGNGNTLYMNLPVNSGKISLGDEEGSLDGGYLIVEVTLHFESQNSDAVPQKRTLLLSAEEQSQVSVVDHSFPDLDPEGTLEMVVEGAFKQYFNTKKVLNEFRYVFSTVDINNQATGDFAWMKPSDTGYAVFVPQVNPQEADSLFSILCMTENTTAPSDIQQSVDASVFRGRTADANAVLCISPQKFCQKLLITAATKMIIGTSADDYTSSSDGTELHNKKQILFKDVKLSGNDTADLTIKANNFSIRLVNDHLELSIINASYSKTLYTAYLTLHQRITFETKKVGNKTIFALQEGEEFQGDLNVVVEPSTTAEIFKWVGVALDILSAVLIIGASTAKVIAKCTTTATSAAARVANAAISAAETAEGVAAATEGIAAGTGAARGLIIASKFLAASSVFMVLGLPFTLIETVAVEIAKDKFDKVPSLEEFANNFLSEIAWTGIEKTTLLGARLDNALLMDFKLE